VAVAAVAAAAAVAVLVSAVLAFHSGGSVQPARPVDTPPVDTPSPTDEAVDPVAGVANGPITSAEERFAGVLDPCTVLRPGSGYGEAPVCWIGGLDAGSDLGLFLVSSTLKHPGDARTALRVATRDEVLAEFRCPNEGRCDVVALGPGPDELSVPDGQAIEVVGLHGGDRRSIDLSPAFAPADEEGQPPETIWEVAWSPDRQRVAVRTGYFTAEEGLVARLWVFDADGGRPQLVHSVAYEGPHANRERPLAYIWSLAWSPEGRRLGFIEAEATLGSTERSRAMRAVSLLLPQPGQDAPATATTLYDYTTRPFDEAAFTWSPDGTRIVIRVPGNLLELSPDDGKVLAEHDNIDGFLMWLAKKP
jgi:hypothetical protein